MQITLIITMATAKSNTADTTNAPAAVDDSNTTVDTTATTVEETKTPVEGEQPETKEPETDKVTEPDAKELINVQNMDASLEDLFLDSKGRVHQDYVTNALGAFDKSVKYNELTMLALLKKAKVCVSDTKLTPVALSDAFRTAKIDLVETLTKFIGKGGRVLLSGLEEQFNTRRTDFGNTKEGARLYAEAQVGGNGAIGFGYANTEHKNGMTKTQRTGVGIYVRNSAIEMAASQGF